jgi:hypothetical protein
LSQYDPHGARLFLTAPIGAHRDLKHVMAVRQTATQRLLELKLRRDPKAPNIIIKPRVAVSLLGLDHGIEPDALVARDSDRFHKPVEIKSYPDRAGKTDAADIRSACRQAAAGVIALRNALSRMGVRDAAALVRAEGDLVLRIVHSSNNEGRLVVSTVSLLFFAFSPSCP